MNRTKGLSLACVPTFPHASTWVTGGMITTVPTSADEAKKMGKDLIQKKGGPVLAKLTGTHICIV